MTSKVKYSKVKGINGVASAQKKYINFRTTILRNLENADVTLQIVQLLNLYQVEKENYVQMQESLTRVMGSVDDEKVIPILINVPELTHEILLNNGTIVKGKVLHEDLDRIIIQTQIGLLTISKKEIKLTRPAEIPKAKCIIDGPITEKVHEDKRIFKGKIKNEGIHRADFPKIIFHLYDEATNLIASDSIFVGGNFHMYQSGVQTDASIEPGQSFPFECSVEFPKGTSISYYIKKISWEEFE